MDNEFTRKEEICPLLGDYCDEEHKDCTRCVHEELDYEREQSRLECERQKAYEHEMETLLWEEEFK